MVSVACIEYMPSHTFPFVQEAAIMLCATQQQGNAWGSM